MTESSLILFARAPALGRVKSRLVPALGESGALALYRQLLARQLAAINAHSASDKVLAIDGDVSHPDFAGFNGRVQVQQGSDIGARMHHALSDAIDRTGKAVLMGCDCPEVDCTYIDAAFSALEEGADVVFGPAADGGYALIGARDSHEFLFSDINWGTDEVMAQSRSKLSALGLVWIELPVIHDIDEPADLAILEAFPGFSY